MKKFFCPDLCHYPVTILKYRSRLLIFFGKICILKSILEDFVIFATFTYLLVQLLSPWNLLNLKVFPYTLFKI